MREGDPIEPDFFEPDPEAEQQPPSRWWRVVRVSVAAVAVLGLIYLSGVYQGFLFRRTPAETVRQPEPSVLEMDTIVLSLQVFVLTGGETLGSLRTGEDVAQIVRNASAIWAQADINLALEQVRFLELNDAEIAVFLTYPEGIIPKLPDYNRNHINAFLTKTLSGINGVAFVGLRSTAVADFTTSNDFRTFAHEVGHVLGLEHVSDRGRLMSQGSSGIELSRKEILQARTVAEKFTQE